MRSERQQAPSPLSVLRQRNFRLYWIGQFISLTGSWMQALAQSLLVLSLTHTAFALGMINFVAALPPAALLLYGGAVTDRLDKRRILIVTQCFFALAAFGLAALVHWGHVQLWHIIALAVVLGVAQAFDLPANQALVPELVERHEIPAAVQLNQAIFNGSRVIGPPIAGWLVGWMGLYVAFMANAFSFIPVILTLLVIRAIRPSERRPKGGTLDQIREGYTYVRSHPFLLALLGITASTTVLIFPNLAVLMPFYVKDVLHAGDQVVGLVMGVSGVGAFVGAMSLLVVPENRRMRRIGMGLTGLVIGMSTLGAAPLLHVHSLSVRGSVYPGSVAVACCGSLIMGFSMASSMGLVATFLQQRAPDEMRGRVMSLQSLVFIGIMPFASLLVSKLADVVTMPREMLGAAACYALAALFLFRQVTTHEKAPMLRPAVEAE